MFSCERFLRLAKETISALVEFLKKSHQSLTEGKCSTHSIKAPVRSEIYSVKLVSSSKELLNFHNPGPQGRK